MTTPTASRDRLLVERISALEAERRELDGLLAHVEQVGARLPHEQQLELVRQRLESAVGKKVDPLKRRIEQLHSASTTLAEQWREVDRIATALDQVATDLLPVAHGALARAAGADRGVCALAEELVADLALKLGVNGERVVVPAATDHTTSGTWAIALALRQEGIWTLPVVAHELCHAVVADLKDEHGQTRALSVLNGSWRQQPSLPAAASQLPGPLPHDSASELFADLFAAYCTGPAYAAARMARSVPVDAWKRQPGRGGHPSDAERLRAIFGVLAGIPSQWVSDMVQRDWEASIATAGGADTAPAHVVAAVDAFTAHALDALDSTSSRARFLGDDLLDVGEPLARGEPPDPDADIRDVINAAWAERVRNPTRTGTIERALGHWMDARATRARRPAHRRVSG